MKDYPKPLTPEELDASTNSEEVVFCSCCGQYYHIDDVVWMEEEGAEGFAACKQCGDILESSQTEQRYFFRYKTWYGYLQLCTEDNVDSLGVTEEIVRGLDIRHSQLPTTLGSLRRVFGKVNLIGTNIEDLSPLEYVGSTITVEDSKVISLGSLKHVEEDIKAKGSQLEDLGNLKYVGQSAYFTDTNITSFSKLEHIGDKLYASNTKISSLGELKHVGQVLVLSGTNIKEIDRFEDTNCYFGLSDNHVDSIGAIRHAGGICIENTEIETLNNLECVDEDFLGKGLRTKTLGNLQYVGGSLDLRSSTIEDFGKLKFVGGNLYLPERMRGNSLLGNIEIKGLVRYFK